MKNLFIVLVLACLLSSCSYNITVSSVSVNEQKDLTTIDIQEKAKADSLSYKVIEQKGSVYLVNPKTNLVEKQVKIEMSVADIILLSICIAVIVCVLLL